MFRFGAPAVRPGALLKRPDNLVIDTAHQKIGHGSSSKGMLSMIASIQAGDKCRCVSAWVAPGLKRTIFDGGTKRVTKTEIIRARR